MFGRFANKVTAAVKEQRPDTVCKLNAEKPRKGWFRVAVNGKDVVCLKDMARPFKALREIQLDALVTDILAALQ